jgi:hypothetical protein
VGELDQTTCKLQLAQRRAQEQGRVTGHVRELQRRHQQRQRLAAAGGAAEEGFEGRDQ